VVQLTRFQDFSREVFKILAVFAITEFVGRRCAYGLLHSPRFQAPSPRIPHEGAPMIARRQKWGTAVSEDCSCVPAGTPMGDLDVE
jgi:hypothetical protein